MPLTEHQAQRRRLRFLGLVALAHRHIAYQRGPQVRAVSIAAAPGGGELLGGILRRQPQILERPEVMAFG